MHCARLNRYNLLCPAFRQTVTLKKWYSCADYVRRKDFEWLRWPNSRTSRFTEAFDRGTRNATQFFPVSASYPFAPFLKDEHSPTNVHCWEGILRLLQFINSFRMTNVIEFHDRCTRTSIVRTIRNRRLNKFRYKFFLQV